VRTDRATGDLVFDVTYQNRQHDTSRHRIWVDKDRKIVKKREWYGQDGRQMATFSYENPQRVGGVWFPTRQVVRNMDDRVAGVSEFENIRVNTGLADSLFSVK
jgi:outer membrane lipoprotein-sorting protein